ncbi:hypothetical protein CF15_06360 [Pyrodictium occultum]|uniref:Fe-S oxidoreductase n=1 Tax=Pyrodictium occultum TaxID=2309 RepID=A0A0V8RWC5_PYROC|nr:YkgJ family cysteine cluster protein [Pyrodictium occultum]KSW12358.1 hypothetical protein CF15_06360 [Pyrodictium occultum]
MARGLPVFKCLFCEHCCYFSEEYEMPVVYPWEKRRLEEIASVLGAKLSFKPLQVYMDDEGNCAVALYRWVIRGFCPFFDRATKRCRIHEDKPLACKMYPILLEMPSGNLLVSGKCDWVKKQGPQLMERLAARPNDIPRVFPSEFEAAKKAFIEFLTIASFTKAHRLRPVNVNKLEDCKSVVDMDDYMARFE